MVSKLNQDVDRIAIRIDSQLSEMVAIPVSISFWYIVGLFSNVSRRFIHMQYVVRRKCGAGLIASGSVRTFKALVTLEAPKRGSPVVPQLPTSRTLSPGG